MALVAIHDFRATDSTKALNDSVRDIIPKGVYSGGKLIPGPEPLQVLIEPFAAKSLEGLTVRDDVSNTIVNIEATGYLYLIGIIVKYQPHQKSILNPVAIRSDMFDSHPDRDYFISFGICDLKGGNTIVVPGNLSEAEKDTSPFDQTAAADRGYVISLYADALLSTGYEKAAYDTFENSDRVNASATNMVYNEVLNCFEASAAGQTLTSKTITPDGLTGTITEVMVLVSSDDPLLKIRVRANASSPWITTSAKTPQALGASQGTALQVQFESGMAKKSVFHYCVLAKTLASNVSGIPGLAVIAGTGGGSGGGSGGTVPAHTHPVSDVDGLAAQLAAIPKTFLALLDTPSSFTGAAGRVVAVNPTASAIEFIDIATLIASNRWRNVAATYNAVAGDKIHPDNSAAQAVVNLPTSPVVGDVISIRPKAGTSWSVNRLVLRGQGQPVMGSSSNYNYSTGADCLDVEYQGGTVGWQVYVVGSRL